MYGDGEHIYGDVFASTVNIFIVMFLYKWHLLPICLDGRWEYNWRGSATFVANHPI
ncbi:hypothetical protein CONLIGDRAFT_336898 [Coniochaeta ligniaria NRRL 30616]|uniref:Uncharacterized protein n=1 Tax=Coniochaeta ligniaria NRRL 30616 TaxID=1408157 RepID=A0A1J7JK64_9PEZI|nr:hypothetical protein CONLIGDRAFT_336898 [Coniochaeta ligniaria NRRL 30616]